MGPDSTTWFLPRMGASFLRHVPGTGGEENAMISIAQFKEVELKVGRVVEAKTHPNADRLLVLGVEIGGVRKEVVAGIALHYKPEELVGKQVVVVNNLQPATLRGVESSGMILAAQDGERLSLVVPERAVSEGSVVR
jgi:methionyl-tRNA synthetase